MGDNMNSLTFLWSFCFFICTYSFTYINKELPLVQQHWIGLWDLLWNKNPLIYIIMKRVINSDGIKIPAEYSKTSTCARGSPDLSVAAPQWPWAMTASERRMQMDAAVCAPRHYLAACDQSSAHIRLVSLPESENRNSGCHRWPSAGHLSHPVADPPGWQRLPRLSFLLVVTKSRIKMPRCYTRMHNSPKSVMFFLWYRISTVCHFHWCDLSHTALVPRGAVPARWGAIR